MAEIGSTYGMGLIDFIKSILTFSSLFEHWVIYLMLAQMDKNDSIGEKKRGRPLYNYYRTYMLGEDTAIH